MYSIMENPMTACGCFECIVMLIPEANGVMVVSREDTSMTPAGMTFSTLAGIAGGGLQTPGVMGVGKFYLISPKFISADGGFKRVVWMSSILKQTMSYEFKAVCEREGDPDLLGVYEGVPHTERADYGLGFVMPDRIVVYRVPICAMCETEEEVVDEVLVTVVHELAHHFGIDDEQLEQLGWD